MLSLFICDGFNWICGIRNYIVCWLNQLANYSIFQDFESAIAISDIQMKLASVKELPKNKMQLATPPKIYT